MQIDQLLTDSTVLAELGERLRSRRLERNWSQQELADRAGVGLTTVQKLESGRDTQLTSAIKVLRALNLMDRVDGLIPQATPGPIVRREMEALAAKRTRRRAGRRTSAGN